MADRLRLLEKASLLPEMPIAHKMRAGILFRVRDVLYTQRKERGCWEANTIQIMVLSLEKGVRWNNV